LWLSSWEAALKALKIVGLVALAFWMVVMTIQVMEIRRFARDACTNAYVAANPSKMVFDYPCGR
jgi:hypothetical protein